MVEPAGSWGDELYATVEAYAAFGDHRTGTPVDDETIAWFAAQLAALGGQVDVQPFDFDRYDTRWELSVDGEAVPSIPLFYESVGAVETAAPYVTSASVVGGAAVPDLPAITGAAIEAGAVAAVVATDVPGGRLCAVNRYPRLREGGFPVVLVPGSMAGNLSAADIRLRLSAQVVAGRSANVVATIGEGPDDVRVMLATPLSGWFRCAGERGTGIAICLTVAGRLAAAGVPVTVLGTSGHELNGLGLHHWLERNRPAHRGIFHFGANLASGDADGRTTPTSLTPYSRPTAWLPGREDQVRAALSVLAGTVRVATDDDLNRRDFWVGESRAWAPLRKPLVSVAGGFLLHHDPDDLPALATAPTLLEQAATAALEAAHLLALA